MIAVRQAAEELAHDAPLYFLLVPAPVAPPLTFPLTDKEPDLGFGKLARLDAAGLGLPLTVTLTYARAHARAHSGVTSPFWDRVFGTTYVSQPASTSSQSAKSSK